MMLTPSSNHRHHHRASHMTKENVDPSPAPLPELTSHRLPFSSKPFAARNRNPLPSRPPLPPSNLLKRKLCLDGATAAPPPAQQTETGDSGIQVVVRIRPLVHEEEEGEKGVEEVTVCKTAANSVAIQGHDFTFDSVADVTSAQEDIFQLVGLPLVENCLAGFNSSIFAYGQTGSGKTHTMWGPLSALSEDASESSERGLTPRIFERLFSRIKEEQAKHADEELTYHCCCSFLEIYNEQITDLLEPSQKNLQIREDVRTSCVYVESLTKELVFNMKDVTQLLVKGLANRKTGATAANADSSRSHCVFTCVINSESKNLEDGSKNTRTSRINLVDLAGSERQKLTQAAGDRLKEAGNINRSLSQLGNLINILAEISTSGKQRHHVPYRDSKLTFLLQESLGGNAKLAMICAVSPSKSYKGETLSTLRFAQRAKVMKNHAIVNKQREDDANVLHEQIRQLKDELNQMKSNGGFNHPAAIPTIKDDSDEEMEIGENDEYAGGSVLYDELKQRQVFIDELNQMKSNGGFNHPAAIPTIKDDSDEEMEIGENDESAGGSVLYDELKQRQVFKAVEKVLAGAIRREMERDEQCANQAAEIRLLNRLVQQYKHERECNAVISRAREEKIARLESLMDGIFPAEEFMQKEYLSLINQHKILQKKYEDHPEVLCANIQLKRAQEKLEEYKNYKDEKEVLLEEIQDLKNQLHYMLSSSTNSAVHFPSIPETKDNAGDENLVDAPNLTDELRAELETNRSLAGMLQLELASEKKCSEELREALQTAMQGHARILEQYAELQEKHVALLAMHRKISDGTEDVKKAAAKTEEISVLRDENRGLQAQLQGAVEALQAAGEKLVRLKEAEEAAALAQRRALLAEQETAKAYKEIGDLKKNYDREILLINRFLSEPGDQQWPGLFGASVAEVSKSNDPSLWFFGYDRCNI